MDPLVRLTLRPLGPWSTPWRADTLLGALAVAWARSHGPAALRRDFLEPWLSGEPPFVLSDAFPGDLLPVPAQVPLWGWPSSERKAVKKLRWLGRDDFRRVQQGERPTLDASGAGFLNGLRLRNTVSRASGSAGAEGGELFEVPYSTLEDEAGGLTVYARVAGEGLALLMASLDLLALAGFGARAASGHGAFEIAREPEPDPELDDIADADGFVALSSFQPATTDPFRGYWRSVVKYGKLAPEFHEVAVFKRPQVMLEPGACFRTAGPPNGRYGAAIGPERLLDDEARQAFAERGVEIVQPAFALAVPMRWPPGLGSGAPAQETNS